MYTTHLENLAESLRGVLGDKLIDIQVRYGELTINVRAEDIFAASEMLRDDPTLAFDTLIDLCGIDYSTYARRPIR